MLIRSRPALRHWVEAAAAHFLDPAEAVCMLVFRWAEDPELAGRLPDLVCGMIGGGFTLRMGEGEWSLPIPIASTHEPEFDEAGLTAFGAEQIGPGVWALSPSLNLPGQVHGFVVLVGVPDPPPWQRLIVIP